jgi:hypothetical protein
VKAHIARITEKLEQQTRLQVAMLAILAHEKLCPDPGCQCRRHTQPPVFSVITAA